MERSFREGILFSMIDRSELVVGEKYCFIWRDDYGKKFQSEGRLLVIKPILFGLLGNIYYFSSGCKVISKLGKKEIWKEKEKICQL